MTNEELIERIRNSSADKTECMTQLYKLNRGIMYKTAQKYAKNADIEDLMQECYIILDEAVNSFDCGRGTKFITHLVNMLHWKLPAYIFGISTPVKMPLEFKELIRKYLSFCQSYQQTFGTKPTDKEYMRALNLDESKLRKLKIAIASLKTKSFDEPIADGEGEMYLSEVIASDENFEDDITDSAEEEYRKQELHKAIDRLKPSEGIVMKRNRLEGESLKQIAFDMGISMQYCAQLGKQAVQNLRKDSELVKAITNYDSYSDYHYSVTRFKNTHISSVEFAVIKNEEALRQWGELYQQIKAQKYAIQS